MCKLNYLALKRYNYRVPNVHFSALIMDSECISFEFEFVHWLVFSTLYTFCTLLDEPSPTAS